MVVSEKTANAWAAIVVVGLLLFLATAGLTVRWVVVALARQWQDWRSEESADTMLMRGVGTFGLWRQASGQCYAVFVSKEGTVVTMNVSRPAEINGQQRQAFECGK